MQWLHAACHALPGLFAPCCCIGIFLICFLPRGKISAKLQQDLHGSATWSHALKYIKKVRTTTTKPWSFEIPCRAKAWALLSREDESCVSELEPLVHKLLFSHLIPNLCNRNQMGCNCRQRETHGWLRCWNCSLKDEQEPAVTLTEATALELSMIYCPNLCPHLSPVLFSWMTQDGAAPAQGTL